VTYELFGEVSQGWQGVCICYTAAARKILRSRPQITEAVVAADRTQPVLGGWALLTAELERVEVLNPPSDLHWRFVKEHLLDLGAQHVNILTRLPHAVQFWVVR
jgi:hypothetical protein